LQPLSSGYRGELEWAQTFTLNKTLRILLIEDHPSISGLIVEGMQRRGFRVDPVFTLADADAYLAATRYDAVVLDLGLPDGDGTAWLRGQPSDHAPVLVLTARDALGDRVAGLDAGADDYLVKPADNEEIAARLRALLRRPGARRQTTLTEGAISLDPATYEVRVYDDLVSLGRRETELLELLLRRCGRVVAREAIEAVLYGPTEAVTPNAVEAVASRLRRRLSEAGIGNRLHTVRGVGYYLGEARP